MAKAKAAKKVAQAAVKAETKKKVILLAALFMCLARALISAVARRSRHSRAAAPPLTRRLGTARPAPRRLPSWRAATQMTLLMRTTARTTSPS